MDKPILFSSAMVQAILDGRKTQTRRVLKTRAGGMLPSFVYKAELQPDGHLRISYPGVIMTLPDTRCPYGMPGDRLWVRETCQLFSISGIAGSETNPEKWTIRYKAGKGLKTVQKQNERWGNFDKWTPSIFMPRWASRITLNVTNVRVERLQHITESDAISEGCKAWGNYDTAASDFAHLWDTINEKRGYPWQSNPWVWVIEFKPESVARSAQQGNAADATSKVFRKVDCATLGES